MRLDEKVVVVTGAESGIGRAIALACAEQGARLMLAGLDAEGLAQTAALAAWRRPPASLPTSARAIRWPG